MDEAKILHKQITDILASYPRSGEPFHLGMKDDYFDQETSVKQPVPSQKIGHQSEKEKTLTE